MIPFIVSCLILVVLVSWALFGRKPVKPKAETNCECGGCAVVRKASQPIEGAHGAYEEPDHVREKREALVIRRQKWARKQDLEAEIYSLIGEVREKGDR